MRLIQHYKDMYISYVYTHMYIWVPIAIIEEEVMMWRGGNPGGFGGERRCIKDAVHIYIWSCKNRVYISIKNIKK